MVVEEPVEIRKALDAWVQDAHARVYDGWGLGAVGRGHGEGEASNESESESKIGR